MHKMNWEDIMAKLDKSCHFVFIHRKGYDEHGSEVGSEWFLETGFCTMAKHPEYFLWVNCDQKEIPYFVEKYNFQKEFNIHKKREQENKKESEQ